MSQVKKYKAEVISFVNHIDNIYTLELKSLSGNFKYLPGQFLHLAIDEYDPSSQWPESRCFSMQSPPEDESIKLTYSAKGMFTKRMTEELTLGKIIDIKLPYGDLFQQDHEKENVVFIAGGTGITPFLSAFRDTSFNQYKNPKLYLGIRDKDYNIYLDDLKACFNSFLEINYIYQNEKGILDIAKILNKNGLGAIYFISGPQLMIKNFKNYLIANGVSEYNIKTDDWE